MENIINYAGGHQNTQLAALSGSQTGIGVFEDIQEKLYLAGNELLRMENESGNPLNEEQLLRAYAYLKVSQRIKSALILSLMTDSCLPFKTN